MSSFKFFSRNCFRYMLRPSCPSCFIAVHICWKKLYFRCSVPFKEAVKSQVLGPTHRHFVICWFLAVFAPSDSRCPKPSSRPASALHLCRPSPPPAVPSTWGREMLWWEEAQWTTPNLYNAPLKCSEWPANWGKERFQMLRCDRVGWSLQ